MTLTDAGPLLALLDADEADHHRCVAALTDVTLPMLTTWPAFTEVMYLAGRSGGRRPRRHYGGSPIGRS